MAAYVAQRVWLRHTGERNRLIARDFFSLRQFSSPPLTRPVLTTCPSPNPLVQVCPHAIVSMHYFYWKCGKHVDAVLHVDACRRVDGDLPGCSAVRERHVGVLRCMD